MITSVANKQIKNIIQLTKKAKERQAQHVFVAEGVRIFEEIPAGLLQAVYVSESFSAKKGHAVSELFSAQKGHAVSELFLAPKGNTEKISGIQYETVSDAVFQRMSDTKTPQGILCVARQPEYQLEDLLAPPQDENKRPSLHGQRQPFAGNQHQPLSRKQPHLLVLEGIQDPGNLGTIFRTGEGAGITGIILSGCADLFAPKTVRSTMGSICRVPFYHTDDLCGTLSVLKQKQVMLYAAHLKGKTYYDAFDYQGASAFLIGSEANGLTEEAAAMADAYLKIPMGGQLESLNAAMAAGILMYEANRQRRNGKGKETIADMV